MNATPLHCCIPELLGPFGRRSSYVCIELSNALILQNVYNYNITNYLIIPTCNYFSIAKFVHSMINRIVNYQNWQ